MKTGSVLRSADYRAFIALEDSSLEAERPDEQTVIKQCASMGLG